MFPKCSRFSSRPCGACHTWLATFPGQTGRTLWPGIALFPSKSCDALLAAFSRRPDQAWQSRITSWSCEALCAWLAAFPGRSSLSRIALWAGIALRSGHAGLALRSRLPGLSRRPLLSWLPVVQLIKTDLDRIIDLIKTALDCSIDLIKTILDHGIVRDT